jgi:L-rhamnose mutarotase
MTRSLLHDWKVLLTLALGIAVLALLEETGRRYKRRRSQPWPMLTAQITQATIHTDKYESTLTLQYSYYVPDEPYPIPAEYQKQFYDEQKANCWADALRDKNVPVRVDPANSWRSQLWDSDLELIVRTAVPDLEPK